MIALGSIWLAVMGNLPLWQKVLQLGEFSGRTLGWLAGFALMIAATSALLLWLLAWPRFLKVSAGLFFVISAFNSHFMWTYGVVMDPTMLTSTLHTDVREVRDLLSWGMLASLMLVAAPPLVWLYRTPLHWRPLWSQSWRNGLGAILSIAVMLGCGLFIYKDLASLMRNHTSVRYLINPLNTLYASGRLLYQEFNHAQTTLQPVGLDARLGASYAAQKRPPLLLLVVGETARADHFALGGYDRPTTPLLSRRHAGKDLAYFRQVESCGTNTQVSVPCLFSPLTRQDGGNQMPTQENLLDVLQRAGLAVLWVDNQSGCKGVCDRVPHAETSQLKNPEFCSEGECFDEVMLAGLEERIEALAPERKARGVVIVMHQMGSHGPAYAKRTPARLKRFLPECTSITLSDCQRAELINAYDNTIVATDHFLERSIQWLEKQTQLGRYDSGLLYVSDHGESLGESGLYLHGLPYALAPREQKQVPMLSWLSNGLQQRSGRRLGCLRGREEAALSHDHFFHTVLGLMDLKTEAYRAGLDAFAPCA